jgi:alpha-L-fucosidase 2
MKNLLLPAVLAGILLLTVADAANPPDSRLLLWYDRPAQYWEEALPVGNGRIGAMVYGGVHRDHIQLNEETIWSGAPTPKLADPTFREKLRRQRELIFAGKFRAADDLKLTEDEKRALNLGEPQKIPGTSTARHAYQPLGDLFLHFDHGTAREENYRRELNLDTAVATTRYSAGGVAFTREVFSSFPANALVTRVAADRASALSFAAMLDYRRDVKDDMYRYDAELGAKIESVTTPPRPSWTHLGGTRFAWRGRGHPDGTIFDARFEVRLEGGTLTPTPDGFRVTGATTATILMTVGTDFRGAEPAARAARDLEALAGRDYAALRSAHTVDHQALFRRVDLDLGRTRSADMPTNRRIWSQMWGARDNRVDQSKDRDPDLFALHFQFGRYLMIASSRPGTLPPALQGLWNDSLFPVWFGQHTSDINVEMNYWPVEVANLAECHTALLDLVESFVPAGRDSARLAYGARGIVLHAMTNWGPKNSEGGWPDFAAWLARHFWEHYQFSGDRDFLARRAYPFMKDCALFYLDTLVQDPRTGKLVTAPSYSPENRFVAPDDGKPAHLDVGNTMGMAICRDVFRHCIAAATALGTDAAFRDELRTTLAALAPFPVGADGRLLEWRADYGETEPGHRHLSHLYPLYPGDEITPRTTPDLAGAAKKALLRRLDHNSGWTGWSRGWAINLAARLGDGALAHEQLRLQLERTTFPNLMDAHPRLGGTTQCFQIDGNFATTAAIAEMLLQSHTPSTGSAGSPQASSGQATEIDLLPALPPLWKQGSVSGLRARGGFTVGIKWQGGVLAAATVQAQHSGPCTVRARTPFQIGAERSRANGTDHVLTFTATAGQAYSVAATR